jgi:DNA-binding IclR family transcriptional regulator
VTGVAKPRTPLERAAANSSQTLDRGLQVLRVLADKPDGLSVIELAAELETHRPVIYRLLGSLEKQRLVARVAGNRFTLGLGLVELASAVRPELQEVATRELRGLAEEVHATTALTVRDRNEAVVVAVIEPRSTNMHIAYRPGLRHPIGVAASGIAILAGGPPLPRERKAVATARERGYAVSTGELLPGATGVAAPILVPRRDVEASISAVWVEPRNAAEMAIPVMASAKAIAAALA